MIRRLVNHSTSQSVSPTDGQTCTVLKLASKSTSHSVSQVNNSFNQAKKKIV